MVSEICFKRVCLTEQVANDLREKIAMGQLSTNSKLPNSRELARRYGISHNVMLKSLHQLCNENIICLNSRRKGYEIP